MKATWKKSNACLFLGLNKRCGLPDGVMSSCSSHWVGWGICRRLLSLLLRPTCHFSGSPPPQFAARGGSLILLIRENYKFLENVLCSISVRSIFFPDCGCWTKLSCNGSFFFSFFCQGIFKNADYQLIVLQLASKSGNSNNCHNISLMWGQSVIKQLAKTFGLNQRVCHVQFVFGFCWNAWIGLYIGTEQAELIVFSDAVHPSVVAKEEQFSLWTVHGAGSNLKNFSPF